VAVAALGAAVEATDWQRIRGGEGARGERVNDWAYLPVRPGLREGGVHGVLCRHSLAQPEEIAYYLVSAPDGTPVDEMARAAGSRWAIEDVFKLAKGRVGRDHYEVRSWAGWYCHMTLAALALALLAASTRKRGPPQRPTTCSR
jgi:SRSO17 transposase